LMLPIQVCRNDLRRFTSIMYSRHSDGSLRVCGEASFGLEAADEACLDRTPSVEFDDTGVLKHDHHPV
jgi:hypothetical protein